MTGAIRTVNLFYTLVFLFFATLSADLLHIQIFLFKCKLNHLIASVLFVLLLFSGKQFKLDRSILNCFLLLLASIALSLVFSKNFERSFGYLLVYIFEFLCYFIIPFNLICQWDSERIFKLYMLSFKIIGCYAAFQLLLSFFGVYDPFLTQKMWALARPNGLSYEPSYYALYMCPFVMFYNALYLFGEKKKVLRLLLVNFLLLISTSTGAFFAYFIFFFFAFFLAPKKKVLQLFSVLSSSVFLAALCFPHLFKDYFLKFFYRGFFEHHSFYERWRGIVNSFNVFLEHPLFGVGLGGVGPYLYHEKVLDGLSAVPMQLGLKDIEFYDPMNVLTEVMASLGIFGLLSFFALGWVFLRMYRRAPRSAMTSSLFLSFIVMMIVLQFNQGLFRSYIWVYSAICYAYWKISSGAC